MIDWILIVMKAPTSFSCEIPVDVPEEIHYKAKGKIVGPGGQNVKYIQRKCNCRVQLKGRGSGFKEGPEFRM